MQFYTHVNVCTNHTYIRVYIYMYIYILIYIENMCNSSMQKQK